MKDYFQKQNFSAEQIAKFYNNAKRDLEIAQKDPFPEVQFNFCYNALIKLGITLIAGTKSLKVRSIPGHHVKIIEAMSEILNDETILACGNAMRMKRNEDLYGTGIFVSDLERKTYITLLESILEKVKLKLKL